MITKSRTCAVLLSLIAVLAVGPAAALEVNTVGDISYVSGGVGASEREELERVKSDYNLRLLFAVSGSGEFLAKVPVAIADQSGQVVLEAVSDGPYFYANVPPGSYRISADNAGNVQTRSVTVPATGAALGDFRWSPQQ